MRFPILRSHEYVYFPSQLETLFSLWSTVTIVFVLFDDCDGSATILFFQIWFDASKHRYRHIVGVDEVILAKQYRSTSFSFAICVR